MQTYLELVVRAPGGELGFKRVYTNGHTRRARRAGPVDVDERLGAMQFGGAGDNAIHPTQLSVTASLLRAGVGFDETVAHRARGHQAGGRRRRARQQMGLGEGGARASSAWCASFVSKNPELAHCLPDGLRERSSRRSGAAPTWSIAGTAAGRSRPSAAWVTGSFGKLAPAVAGARAGNGDTPAAYPDLGLYMFVPVDEASLPPRQWLYGRHYQRRTVSVTASPGGTGKTSLVMVEAVAMATGRNLLGEQPAERLRVWYHNGEDAREELTRRLVAICKHYDIPQDELTGQLVITSGNEFPLRVAKGYSDLKIDTPLVDHISAQISKHQIDIAVLDPLVTLHNVSESDNNRMDTVVRVFAGIAAEQDCAFELEHHTRKLRIGDTDFDGDDMRGASCYSRRRAGCACLEPHVGERRGATGNPGARAHAIFPRGQGQGQQCPGEPGGVALLRKRRHWPMATRWASWRPTRCPDMASAPRRWPRPRPGRPGLPGVLARYARESIEVNNKPRGHYAPRVFAKEPEAKQARVGQAALEDAMRRLIKDTRVKVVSETVRGRTVTHLELA